MVIDTHNRKIDMSEVKAGDVLLSYGDDWISWAIRLLDGGDYSHAALFDGNKIVEAGLRGVVMTPLEKEVSAQKYVDVYRFKSDSGSPFSFPDWPVEPVIQKAHYYFDKKTTYANNQLFLLGFLLVFKKFPINHVKKAALRTCLILVLKLYKKITQGKETKSVVCSELVYRSFYEAVPKGKYGLYVVRENFFTGEFPLMRASSTNPNSLAELESNESIEDDVHDDEIEEIVDQIEQMSSSVELELADLSSNDEIYSLLTTSKPLVGTSSPLAGASNPLPTSKPLVGTSSPLPEASNPLVVAEMVTPHDLQKSHNLEKIGCLRKPAE